MQKKLILCLLLMILTSLLKAQIIAEQNEEFDPLTLNEPPISFLKEAKIYEIISENRDFSQAGFSETEVREIERDGWKIQLISTKNYYVADSLKKAAQKYFPEEEIVTIFNSPYYKIRLGNCNRRIDAENLHKQAIRHRFNNAWIIPTRIKVKEKTIIR